MDAQKRLFEFLPDQYTLRARTQPALLVLLPLGILLFIWSPGDSLPAGALLGFIVSGGGAALLAQMGRDRGRQKQNELWMSWGGAPTTQLWRYQDSNDPITLNRWRTKYENLTGSHLPTKEEDSANLTAADHHYMAATSYLLEETRDRSRFPLVFAENVNYGYRRNLWGYKSHGFVIAIIAAVLSWGIFIASNELITWQAWYETVLSDPESSTIIRFVGAVVNSAAVGFWTKVITPDWVRISAEAYAQRLLASIDVLEPTTSEVESAE